MKKINLSAKLYVPLVVCVYLAILIVSVRYFNNPYLWFDEAGQFWISKGLNHDSEPLSVCGTIVDVVKNNQNYNLDPGGFGIMLHYWTIISNHHRWLRMLPYSFFLLTIVGFIYLSYKWTQNKYISSIAGLIPFMNMMILSEAFEIRAYSMEVLGCVCCILAVESLRNSISYKKLALWALILSFFLTSRYSFVMAAFVTSTYVLYLIYKTNSLHKTKLVDIVVYATPLFITLGMIYVFSLRVQNPHIDALNYLPYIKTNPEVILSKESMQIILYIGFLILIALKFIDTDVIRKYQGLLYVTICTNILFFILSILGLHPWEGSCTRCISIITLNVISMSALCGEFLKQMYEKADIKYATLLLCILKLYSVSYELKENYIMRYDCYRDLISINYAQSNICVDRWESPCMRYLFEYGKLKGTANYPQSFTFMKGEKHSHNDNENKSPTKQDYYNKLPYLNDLYDDYDLLIVPELYEHKKEQSDKWVSIHNNNRVWIHKN